MKKVLEYIRIHKVELVVQITVDTIVGIIVALVSKNF